MSHHKNALRHSSVENDRSLGTKRSFEDWDVQVRKSDSVGFHMKE